MLDLGDFGPTMLIRSFAHLGFVLLAFGLSWLDPLMLALDFIQFGFAASLQTLV